MDYDLSRLSSREFEHLVHALVAAVVAPGMAIYGDGPDDGRDAAFRGPLPYPSPEAGWDGYTVVQAKFRQRSGRGGVDDARWLEERIENELSAYRDGERRWPDNLLLATNVVLTPPRGGGKDRVALSMQAAAKELRLSGWDVWDYDKLRTLIDGCEAVRRAYGAWITPGDVLHEIVVRLSVGTPDFEQTLATFLQKELIADQYVNLEQAGHANEDKIPLGRVFVDLPLKSDHGGDRRSCIEHLLELSGTARGTPANRREPRPETERVVLVGGPGQGKSTLGQFLCQLHRAALLVERDPTTIAPEAEQALESVLACAREDGLKLPRARRFPLRVILSSYAAVLASEKGPRSLLAYLVEHINEITEANLSVSLFRRWLAEHAWLVVLDGLDEVPATSNRDQVLSSIADFWVDVASAQGDVFVVATTRPQGYNEDFAPSHHLHLELDALGPKPALRYGKRLALERFSGDRDRIRKVSARLERAAATDATQRLMQSPLQVTIMTALVDRMGQPPQERWSLFHDYYDVVYHRERERDIPASEVLREYRTNVDVIHQRAALLLQLKSERARQTEARLSRAELTAIVEQRLEVEGHDRERVVELRDLIIDAACSRLVFLVGLEDDRVGFEIRSLQEFMAAECLMDGSDVNVRRRLEAVAGITSWRNVVRFAAGKCFARREYLCDTIFRICAALDAPSVDPISGAARAGTSLAIDLLLDGAVRRQPLYRTVLAEQVANAFSGVPHPSHAQMWQTFGDDTEAVYRERLREAIEDRCVTEALAAWRTVLALSSDRHLAWAERFERERWPVDPSDELVLLDVVEPRLLPDVAALSLLAGLHRQPAEAIRRRRQVIFDLCRRGEMPAIVDHLNAGGSPEDAVEFAVGHQASAANPAFALAVFGLTGASGRRSPSKAGLHPSWLPALHGHRFRGTPSAAHLAAALRAIAGSCTSAHWRQAIGDPIPWPLAACLAYALDADELLALADVAERGGLGDLREWHAAETRWSGAGAGLADLAGCIRLSDRPFDRSIGVRGFPPLLPLTSIFRFSPTSSGPLIDALFEETASRNARAALMPLLIDAWIVPGPLRRSSVERVRALAEWIDCDAAVTSIPAEAVLGGLDPAAVPGLAAELDAIGRHVKPRQVGSVTSVAPGVVEALSRLVLERPDLAGVWTLLALALRTLDPQQAAQTAARCAEARPRVVEAVATAAVVATYAEDVDAPRAEALATAIARAVTPEDARPVELLLASVRESSAACEWILAALPGRLPTSAVEARMAVAASVDDRLRRRTSPLADRSVWSAAGLFPRDEAVLAV